MHLHFPYRPSVFHNVDSMARKWMMRIHFRSLENFEVAI
jgi:hypothetical protein